MAGSAVVTIVLSSVSMKNAAATMSGIRRDILSGASWGARGVSTAISQCAARWPSGVFSITACPLPPHRPAVRAPARQPPRARRITS